MNAQPQLRNGQPHLRQRLSLLDYAFDLLDTVHSPQDFTVILHFRNAPALEDLRAGARSALNCYPPSDSHIKGKHWVRAANPPDELPKAAAGGTDVIQQFVAEDFDLRVQLPVKQMLLAAGCGDDCLVTRFHHAAADGLSAAMWLGHQLGVAYGLKEPVNAPSQFAELRWRESENSVRRSAFAYRGACDPLWTTNYIPSGSRRWLTINFAATELQRACRRARGFTYSDLLATCALEVLTHWNRKHATKNKQKIGLWLPVNIRRRSPWGFGNGTSRVRLYARYSSAISLADKAREVRKQLSWSVKNGEWVVPKLPLFTSLPRPFVAPLLNGYLKQPSVDMATAVFSHVDRWAGDATEAFKSVTRIECVGLLHQRQHLAINGATHQRQTSLTFTYDPALLDASDARELASMYEQQIARARKELL